MVEESFMKNRDRGRDFSGSSASKGIVVSIAWGPSGAGNDEKSWLLVFPLPIGFGQTDLVEGRYYRYLPACRAGKCPLH